MTEKRNWRWLLAILWAGTSLYPIGLLYAQSAHVLDEQTAVVRFQNAELQLTREQTPPASVLTWEAVSLPDNWNASHPGQGGHGWYKFEFSVAAIPDEVQAIYFPRASMNATVFLNGSLIDNSGGLFENGVRNWNRPFLVQFLPQQLRLGPNQLMIRVDAQANDMGGLSAVAVGTASLLRPEYQQRRFLQLVLPQISGVLIALICVATFGFWVLLRDSLYGYFSLASAAYFVRQIEYWTNDVSWPIAWIQMGVAALVFWFVIFLTLFALRLLRITWPMVEKCLFGLAVCVGLIALVFGSTPWASIVSMGLHIAALVLGLLVLTILIPKVRQVSYVESLPLVGAGCITLVLGVHDVLQRMGVLLTTTPRLSHLGVPILILTMTTILFSRYVKNVKLLEKGNRDLEEQVLQKSNLLIENLDVQYELRKVHAVTQERELILREMHDGVGNYLTIALRASAHSEPDMTLLNSALKNCMLDLRLMIDSLGESDSGADTVATVLGNLRYRIEPALKAEGIELVWKVEEVSIFRPLSSRNVLNLTRIFQEALTNVIKHANATQVLIQSEMVVREQRRWAVITLIDNGTWNNTSSLASHGQDNMRIRALQLEGELLVKRTPDGSSVELSIPEEHREE